MSLIKNIKNSDLKTKWKGLRNAVLQIGPLEQLVRDCTNNEPWAAKMSDKQEIARRTHNYDNYQIIMTTLWRRMQQEGQNYRKIQKSLALLEFLLYQGSDRVVSEAKSNIYQLRSLRNFHYTDDNGKECGSQIRELSRKLVKLLKDENALKEERKKHKKMAGRFQGVSREEAAWGGMGGYGSSSASRGYSSKDYYDSDGDRGISSSAKKYDTDSDDSDLDNSARKEEEEEVVTRPRRDSNIRIHSNSSTSNAPVRSNTTTRTTKVEMPKSPQQPQSKQENMLDMDDFFSSNNNGAGNQQQQQQQQNAFNPRASQQQQQQAADPWGSFEDDATAGNPFDEQVTHNTATPSSAQPKNDLDDAFDDNDFGESDFQAGHEEENSSLFNMSKGLVDLSLSDKPKEQPQDQQGQISRKTLNQMRSEKSGILNPGRAPPMRPPAGGFGGPPPPQNPNMRMGGPGPMGGFGGPPPQNPNMRMGGGYPQNRQMPPQGYRR